MTAAPGVGATSQLPLAVVAALACLAASAALVAFERRGSAAGCAASKLLASSAFVAAAVFAGATATAYGRWVLAALALSWLGDALLLSRRTPPFLAGMGAFLAAHVVFALAFARLPSSASAALVAGLAMAAVGAVTLRWLWPHLRGPMRVAVPAYVLAIAAMCTTAVAAAVGSGAPVLAIGALAFAASDISVARDRFVAAGWGNRAWGLPLYYGAQLALGCSTLALAA